MADRGKEYAFARNGYEFTDGEIVYPHQGLTIREYFAGIALQGLLVDRNPMTKSETIADHAVIYADALIKRLEK